MAGSMGSRQAALSLRGCPTACLGCCADFGPIQPHGLFLAHLSPYFVFFSGIVGCFALSYYGWCFKLSFHFYSVATLLGGISTNPDPFGVGGGKAGPYACFLLYLGYGSCRICAQLRDYRGTLTFKWQGRAPSGYLPSRILQPVIFGVPHLQMSWGGAEFIGQEAGWLMSGSIYSMLCQRPYSCCNQ